MGSQLSSSPGSTSGAGKVEAFSPGSLEDGVMFELLTRFDVATICCLGVGCLYPTLNALDEGVNFRFWWAQGFVFVLGGMVQRVLRSTAKKF